MRKEHIYSKLICGALLLFGICVPVCAQTGHLSGVRVINDEIKKKGREIHVDFVLDVTDMHVKRQESVRLYPVVVAKEGDKSLDLPSVVLDGRVRDKVHRREKALNGFTKTDGAKTVLRRKNGESQQVEYSVVIPYEPWLGAARLVLREQTTGCAECDKGTEETPVKSTFLQLFQPKYTLAFVPPLKEAVKMRDEVKVARLNFRQDSHKIDPKFQNNRQELDSVRHSIAMVKDNGDLTITGIYVTGYASPEGRADYNEKLSRRRAEAFTQYVQRETEVDTRFWHVAWRGEDWEGLRMELDKFPNLLKQKEVIAVVESCKGNLDDCEQRFRDEFPPEVYQRLLNEVYPPLRRNEYRIEYKVRNFNLEEARKQIYSNPRLLSVEEMYQVAESYGVDTPEYGKVLLIAARTYPDNIPAVVNAARYELGQGHMKEAVNLLLPLEGKGNVRVLNCLGVAYANEKQYEKARTVLQRAAATGDAEARENLRNVEGVIADL